MGHGARVRIKRTFFVRSLAWLGRQKTHLVILVTALAFMLVLLAGFLPFGLASDASAFGRFPSDVSIGGVNVSNLTRQEALAKCRTRLSGLAAKPFSLTTDGEAISNTSAELGLELDIEKMIDEGYRTAWSPSIIERMIRRFLRRPRALDVPVYVKYDEAKVRSFAQNAMVLINCKPRNAYLDVSSGSAHMVSAKDGRQADLDQVLAAANQALNEGKRSVEVPLVKRTPPEVPQTNVGKFILVNLDTHTLSLYDKETLLAKYPVATGSKQWPTCIGQWAIVKMEKNPTWYNRGSTWAENMPASLPPGPNNPLGTRAMTLNGGGVLIHGTNDTGSIGSSASHGCIRMYISNVEALFEQCRIGMPVYIIKKSGEPGFDCSRKPFWQ